MSPHYHTIRGHISVNERHHLSDSRHGVPPVAHEITQDSEQSNEVHARSLHAEVPCVADERGSGAAGFDVGEDGVAADMLGAVIERR